MNLRTDSERKWDLDPNQNPKKKKTSASYWYVQISDLNH